ncbi:uncharacterized protein CYBJADRAFT_31840 [Cyberlindnera jadinii NRRL Y-1542]|uniref:Uncharacterized protein n=1 Tax=Cyberlindnera jadinii (strain ATCC 18201 / CBS 1600 / BCRC 20928 / JCM 3617 / NBRC 0987 / NRRL Y-1542) TaxID=983966 RepID=A0A1E4RW71_CYBJN|nr:hypothetical protein CYBJADRAFT_31840 [Cyberlindnera jadinii NRRL Y-1542]ODV71532.1 hypothetical protein CYBJADRAFT_31840 [Cyberlindnera jadinii NRRL Y-1542]
MDCIYNDGVLHSFLTRLLDTTTHERLTAFDLGSSSLSSSFGFFLLLFEGEVLLVEVLRTFLLLLKSYIIGAVSDFFFAISNIFPVQPIQFTYA